MQVPSALSATASRLRPGGTSAHFDSAGSHRALPILGVNSANRDCMTLDMTPLLHVENLKVHFPVRHGLFGRTNAVVKAVDDVTFEIAEGETVGLVGESGCGKSTLGRAAIRLLSPTSGQVRFKGENLLALSRDDLRARRRQFQMVFQDPFSTLNPRMTVGQIIGEALDIHGLAKENRRARIEELLTQVGLDRVHAERYPH